MAIDKVSQPNHRAAELKKHVAVIHSNSKISLLQRKISNALLYHSYNDLLSKDEYEIQISVLSKIIGYDSHDHKKIKQALMDLLSTVVEWNIVDGNKIDKDGVWNASSIIADASIDGSKCTYSYSNKMRKLLYHPSIYGRLNMQVQAKFQSNYGLALYENCSRYQDIGQTPTLEIEKFRKLMGVNENKYKIFRDLKTRVIDKSVEEVNKYSTLLIEPVFKKQNRQVVAIQFLIKKQILIEESKENYSFEDNLIQNQLKIKFGLSQQQIKDVITNYEEKYILEKISLIESSASYLSGKINNLAKYLLSALFADFQPTKKSENIKTREGNTLKTISDEERKFANKSVFEIFDGLTENEKSKLIDDFKIIISRTIHWKSFEESGLKNILVKDAFVQFILNSKNIVVDKLGNKFSK